jgi:hypothetical protein
MALPSTGYDTATVTNPGSALTDFTLMVDLSKASASWWAVVDTADGTKGRAAKSDGTELATDWITFDNGAKTGWLRVKWTGTLAASGSQVLRIYPPNTANSSNAANATYGSDNAYDASWEGYWPDAGTNDRTSNGNDGSGVGGISVGGAAGKVGPGTSYDGSDDSITLVDIAFSNYSMFSWVKSADGSPYREPILCQPTDSRNWLYLGTGSSNQIFVGHRNASTQTTADNPSALADTNWHHVGGTWDGTTVRGYQDNSQFDTDTTGAPPNLSVAFRIGYDDAKIWAGKNWYGVLNEVQFHSAARSAAWIAEEYAQTNANATFWGTWTWNASIAVLLDEEDD